MQRGHCIVYNALMLTAENVIWQTNKYLFITDDDKKLILKIEMAPT